MSASVISYRVIPSAGGHRYIIQQTVPVTPESKISFYLPVWIPGSYARRDFSRFLSDLTVTDSAGNVLAYREKNPSLWTMNVPNDCTKLYFSYRVYARDISVRGCYLDHERGFFNPCCACIAVEGAEHLQHQLTLSLDGLRSHWQISGASPDEEGICTFKDYQHLADTPFIFAAKLDTLTFTVGDTPHDIVISGAIAPYDRTRLSHDVETVCRETARLFSALPFNNDRYRFLLHLTGNIYGGLEHRSSAMLMSPRDYLPKPDMTRPGERYLHLLGLFSHEYFHAWNIKDLKPLIYQPYNLQQEQPSDLLWLFEGFTAFFDNWLLVRAGVISVNAYLNLLAQDISRYLQRPGRHRQTLEQSSTQAWTKLYNGGEDAVNISTTYYIQGALMAFCLDIFLRRHSNDTVHLPLVMYRLWSNYRKTGQGLTEETFTDSISELLPEDAVAPFREFIRKYVHTTAELPLEDAGTYIGLDMLIQPDRLGANSEDNDNNPCISSEPGFRWQKDGDGYRVCRLDERSSAAVNGLAVGDCIIAVNRLNATDKQLSRQLFQATPEDECRLHFFRDGVLGAVTFTLALPVADTCTIRLKTGTDADTIARRCRWFNRQLPE